MDYSTLLPQIKSLHSQIPKTRILSVLIKTLFSSSFAKDKNRNSLTYIYLTRLLWEYIAETLPPLFLTLKEPWEQDPQLITWNKKKVTQEFACAILDFHTIVSELKGYQIETVLTLGANHWQLGYVFLLQIPKVKYIFADDPATIQLAQKHFERIFPEKKIFVYQPFDDFETIRFLFEQCDIVFVDPEQLSLLPSFSIDLGITIDVLDKLNRDEADAYFLELSRLLRGFFYFKEEKESSLKEADYHLPDDWEEIFWRTCPLYPNSFEALFVQENLVGNSQIEKKEIQFKNWI